MFGCLKAVFIGMFACCGAMVAVGEAVAERHDQFYGIFYSGFEKEGKFVSIPAETGNYAGLAAGAAPAALVSGGLHLFGAQEETVLNVGRTTLKCFCFPFGFTFGAPFLTVRYLFWDAPLYLAAGLMGDDRPAAPVK